MKQLHFNVRDAYERVTGKPMPVGSNKDDFTNGFYDGYMARCADQQRRNNALSLAKRKKQPK